MKMEFLRKMLSLVKGEKSKKSSSTQVAFISDKYFLFEEISFPKNSLSRKEIFNMAQASMETMLPPGPYEILSGFFVNAERDKATVFVASKDRLVTSNPDFLQATYWLPEKFLKSFILKDDTFSLDSDCLIIIVGNDGCFSLQDKQYELLSSAFWTAELHSEDTKKSVRRGAELSRIYIKMFWPSVILAVGLICGMAATIVGAIFTKNLEIVAQKRQSHVESIKKRDKLRDELFSFLTDRLSYFRHLNILNKSRPANLLFCEFFMDSPKSVLVSGECKSAYELNTFLGALQNDKSIVNAKSSNVTSTPRKVSFNLKIEFL